MDLNIISDWFVNFNGQDIFNWIWMIEGIFVIGKFLMNVSK